MEKIRALLLEPVGCLAEFPPEPFHEIAVRFWGRKGKSSPSASRNYWHLLNLMESSGALLTEAQVEAIEALECAAVAGSSLYEDVRSVFAELKPMGIRICIATSLSREAATRFLVRNSLAEFCDGVTTRDDAGGVKSVPLLEAMRAGQLSRAGTIYLTDTVEGIKAGRSADVDPILIMNDPDEAQKLATHNPAGGIVSLHELPDFIRLLAARNAG